MVKVKIKGEAQAHVFPAGVSTKLSDDGKNIEVLDKDGKLIEGAAFEQSAISAIALSHP